MSVSVCVKDTDIPLLLFFFFDTNLSRISKLAAENEAGKQRRELHHQSNVPILLWPIDPSRRRHYVASTRRITIIHTRSLTPQTYLTYTAAKISKHVTACNLPSPKVHYGFTDKQFTTQTSHFCSEPSTDYASSNLFRSRDNSESINRSAIWYQPSVRSSSQPKVSTYTEQNKRRRGHPYL